MTTEESLRKEIERLTREMAQLQRFKWNDEQMRLAQERENAAERQVATLREALEVFQSYGCPVCNGGDCASANPPVALCPMRMAYAALARAKS